MGLLERRRALMSSGEDLDGKYVALIQVSNVSPYNGHVLLSSDYGKTFEIITDWNGNLSGNSRPGVAVNVESGNPVVYYCSGSGGKLGFFKWKGGSVNLITTSSNGWYVHCPLYCLGEDALICVEAGYNRLNYVYDGVSHLYAGVTSYNVAPKGWKSGRFISTGYFYNNTNTNAIWSPVEYAKSTFTVKSGSMYNWYPVSASRPTAAGTQDADISPDGHASVSTLQGGVIIAEGMESVAPYAHTVGVNQIVTSSNSNLLAGITLAEDSMFVSFRTGAGTTYSSYVSRLKGYNDPSVEVTSLLPPPEGGSYPNYGYYSMSLWSNKRGDKVICLGKGYNGTSTNLMYSHDSGVTWQKATFASGSGLFVCAASVYRG